MQAVLAPAAAIHALTAFATAASTSFPERHAGGCAVADDRAVIVLRFVKIDDGGRAQVRRDLGRDRVKTAGADDGRAVEEDVARPSVGTPTASATVSAPVTLVPGTEVVATSVMVWLDFPMLFCAGSRSGATPQAESTRSLPTRQTPFSPSDAVASKSSRKPMGQSKSRHRLRSR